MAGLMKCSVPGCQAMPFKFTTDGAGAPTTATATANAYTVAYAAGVYTISPKNKYVGLDGAAFMIEEGLTKLVPECTSDSLNQASGYVKFTVYDCNVCRSLGAPDTAAVDAVHANFLGTSATHPFPGPFTDPDVPRNVVVDYEALYDGGDTTVTGTNQFDEAQTEVFTAVAGSTVAGVKIFKTVTAATKTAVGVEAASASIGHGTKIGLQARLDSAYGLLMCDGVAEDSTIDATYNGVTVTTAPNGTKAFTLICDSKVEAPIVSGTVVGCLYLNETGARSEP